MSTEQDSKPQSVAPTAAEHVAAANQLLKSLQAKIGDHPEIAEALNKLESGAGRVVLDTVERRAVRERLLHSARIVQQHAVVIYQPERKAAVHWVLRGERLHGERSACERSTYQSQNSRQWGWLPMAHLATPGGNGRREARSHSKRLDAPAQLL